MPPSQLSVPNELSLTSNGQTLLQLKGTATPPAAIVYAPSAAVTDSDLSPNTIAPSIDQTAHALRIRAEYSDTTLRTAVIPFQPNSTLTVGASGADFTSIQAAWNFLKSRLLQSAVTIAVDPGTYNEAVTLNEQPFANLITIQGDTRVAAGQHFVTTGSITKSGNNCTITLTSAPPSDFTSSDHVIIGGASSATNVGRFPIVSINTGSKTVTYENAGGVAEAVFVNTELIFCPNRILSFTGLGNGITSGCPAPATVVGFTLLSSTTGVTAVSVPSAAALNVSRCAAFAINDFGFQAQDGGNLKLDTRCTAVKCLRGFVSTRNSYLLADGTYAADSGSIGYLAVGSAYLSANNAVATKCAYGCLTQDCGTLYMANGAISHHTSYGVLATNNGVAYLDGGKARNNATAYAASWNGLTVATSTSASNSGNTTNYSPATSGTPGNSDGLINWS